jgi:hypothetical protein
MEKEMEGILPLNRLRVTDRKEAGSHSDEKPDEERPKPFQRPELLPDEQNRRNLLWWGCHLEIGRLLIEKRNIELALFTQLSEAVSADHERNLARIHQRIGELERRLLELEGSEKTDDNSPADPVVTNLDTASALYDGYIALTENETASINADDLDTLDGIMQRKSELLERIEQVQTGIEFAAFQALPEGSEKRIKADGIIADINTKIRTILDQENTNSVELQNRREAVRVELTRGTAGTRVISKYANTEQRPRFIDTTK